MAYFPLESLTLSLPHTYTSTQQINMEVITLSKLSRTSVSLCLHRHKASFKQQSLRKLTSDDTSRENTSNETWRTQEFIEINTVKRYLPPSPDLTHAITLSYNQYEPPFLESSYWQPTSFSRMTALQKPTDISSSLQLQSHKHTHQE